MGPPRIIRAEYPATPPGILSPLYPLPCSGTSPDLFSPSLIMPSPSFSTCCTTRTFLLIRPLLRVKESSNISGDDLLRHFLHGFSPVHARLLYPSEGLALGDIFHFHEQPLGLFYDLSGLNGLFKVPVLFPYRLALVEARDRELHPRH